IDRGTAGPHGADQRARGERPSGLFRDDAEAFVAEREAAVFLGPRNAGPTEFDHLRPRAAVEAVGAVVVAQLAQLRKRRVGRTKRLRGVLEHVLLFVENHRHRRPLSRFVRWGTVATRRGREAKDTRDPPSKATMKTDSIPLVETAAGPF